MTDEAMSPLHRHMIEDVAIWKFSSKIQRGYIRTPPKVRMSKLLQLEMRRSLDEQFETVSVGRDRSF
jgi:hypothetical protein